VERLDLNLKVYQSRVSPAWLEARHGRLWEQGIEGIERYNVLRKTEPMQRALRELQVHSWFAGLRRDQSQSRRGIRPLEWRDGRWKVHPICDWTDRMIFDYLRAHELPYHPLWHEGYVSIGDWHTTRTLAEAGDAEATRFFGLKRECGLHGLEG
jgi:phosphoadenosine phosphosulfate reductase